MLVKLLSLAVGTQKCTLTTKIKREVLPRLIAMSDRMSGGIQSEGVSAAVYNYKVRRVRLTIGVTYKIHVHVGGGGRWGVERGWESLEAFVKSLPSDSPDGTSLDTLAECNLEVSGASVSREATSQ